MKRYRRVLAMLWSLVAVILVGCAAIPDSGGPVAVPQTNQDPGREPDVNVAIPGPRPGGNPQETITALIAAGGITQNRGRLSEEFLTLSAQDTFESAGSTWLVRFPDNPVAVERNTADIAVVGITGQVIGEIDTTGTYSHQNRELKLSLRLIKVGQTWLISSPPPAVLVNEADFSKAFREVTVYFPAIDTGALIPEARYLDSSIQTSALPTPIVRMLLAGPAPWLANASQSRVPSGTRLRGNATVSGTDVIVDFSPEIESAEPAAINTFAAQIGWSLRPYISGKVRLLVNGRRIAIEGVPASQGRAQWERHNPAAVDSPKLYGVKDGAVARLNGATPEFVDETARSGVISAAISLDGEAIAVVRQTDQGQELRIGEIDGSLRVALQGQQLARPTWGAGSTTVLTSVDGSLHQVSREGVAVNVDVEEIGEVHQVRLALDGVRVLLGVIQPQGTSVHIGLFREGHTSTENSQGQAPSITHLQPLPRPFANLADVGWYAPTVAVVAGYDTSGAGAVWEVDLDSPSQRSMPRRGLPTEKLTIAAIPTAPSEQPIYASTGDHVVQRFRERWAVVQGTSGVTAPFYPG